MGSRGLSQPSATALVRIRMKKGMTQEALATRAGCSLRTVQRAETGAAVRTSILHEISEALECPPADIEARARSPLAVELTGHPSSSRNVLGIGGTMVAALAISILAFRASDVQPELGVPVVADINADGRDELVISNHSTGRWVVVGSDGRKLLVHASAPALGADGDVLLAGDVNGDAADELIIWRGRIQEWQVIDVLANEIINVQSPAGGGRRLVGDLDGDQRDDFVTWRPSHYGWTAITLDGKRLFENRPFGRPGDEPLLGDFDGDGRDDCAAWRPYTGQWLSRGLNKTSSLGRLLFAGVDWGQPGDVPLVGDFDGDGRDDLAYWRPTDGEWAARRAPVEGSHQPAEVLFRGVRLGRRGDLPLVGDFDGDGRADISVWSVSEGVWSGLTELGMERFDVELKLIEEAF